MPEKFKVRFYETILIKYGISGTTFMVLLVDSSKVIVLQFLLRRFVGIHLKAFIVTVGEEMNVVVVLHGHNSFSLDEQKMKNSQHVSKRRSAQSLKVRFGDGSRITQFLEQFWHDFMDGLRFTVWQKVSRHQKLVEKFEQGPKCQNKSM